MTNKTIHSYGILCTILMVLFVWSCASVHDQWQQASSVDSAEAYEVFLANNPRSEFSSEARLRLVELAFDQTLRADSLAAYQEFLDKYSDTPQAKEAREGLATLALEECKEENTLQGYMSFIEQYKGTRAAKEASVRLDNLMDWSSIKGLVQRPIISDQKSIGLEGFSSSYHDLHELKWNGPQPLMADWLGLRLQNVDEAYGVAQIMKSYNGTPVFMAKYPKGLILLPNGSTIEIYSHPTDPLEFSWGNLKGQFVEGKGWEFGPFSNADVLKWKTGRGIVVLKNRDKTEGISYGVK